MTRMAPVTSSHPEPARTPPMTGIGTNRTRFPARSRPSAPSNTPVPSVATRIAVTRVRKTRSELSPGIAATTFAPISAKIGATRA